MAVQHQFMSPQGYINELVRKRNSLRVLDAGCGARASFELPTDARLIGIDISQDAAKRNQRINEIIIGDLQTYKLPSKSFDIIICCDVLEHLSRPDLALLSFFDAIKDDGIIVLELPNVFSLKGLVTKFTPHQFHVWVLRKFLNFENAGKPGFAPFPTFLRTRIAPGPLLRFGAAHQMTPIYFRLHEGPTTAKLRRNSPKSYKSYALLVRVLNYLFLRRVDFGLSDMQLVLRRDVLESER